MALNPHRRIFLNLGKSFILPCLLQFDYKQWGSPSSILYYKHLKLKVRVFLADHIVTMVTYCATKSKATCSPMIGQFLIPRFDINRYRVVIMTHQNLSLGKSFEPPVYSVLNRLPDVCIV